MCVVNRCILLCVCGDVLAEVKANGAIRQFAEVELIKFVYRHAVETSIIASEFILGKGRA
ncbi:hypothetical protein D3C80_1939690 [compost metagenome]